MNGIRISELVKRYRKEQRLNQSDFGRLLGVSGNAVSKWEREICYPDVTTLPQLAKILHVEINDLFENEK